MDCISLHVFAAAGAPQQAFGNVEELTHRNPPR